MSASVKFSEDAILFSPDMPQEVNFLLQTAVVAGRYDKAKAEDLFLQALQIDRQCLQTYFALYKFYFYQARLQDAERYVLAGLQEAARQGGFPDDFALLTEQPKRWDMYQNEMALFYLYSMKALAFIRLRLQQRPSAEVVLSCLQRLDPEDRSGGSVIMDLALALQEEGE